MSIVVGVDLAGVERRNTGMCVLDNRLHAEASILHTDKEIIEFIHEIKPNVVAIDAPLSVPTGRKTIEDRSGNTPMKH